MTMLKLAINSRTPFVHVKTDDILNIRRILADIAGVEVSPLPSFDSVSKLDTSTSDVFFTSDDVASPHLYARLKAENKCVVFVNTKPGVLHLQAGTMFPPQHMIYAELCKMVPAEVAKEALPAFGGTTLKDTYEITRMVLQEGNAVTPKSVNTVRQSYVSKLKGISQVNADYAFYQVPSYLYNWCSRNLPFFSNPIHPDLIPRGVMFGGAPGTGKTMGAKYIANKLGVPLYRVDIGAMKGKYVGDSEGNLNAALAQIDQASPCVVIFDEVEKIFSSVGVGDSGVTSGMLASVLWWLQEHKSKVFTIMTTNNPDVIPPELYREGRINAFLEFMGLTSYSEALTFSNSVLSNLTGSIEVFTKNMIVDVLNIMMEAIELHFSTSSTLPQVTATNMVHEAVKQVLLSSAPLQSSAKVVK